MYLDLYKAEPLAVSAKVVASQMSLIFIRAIPHHSQENRSKRGKEAVPRERKAVARVQGHTSPRLWARPPPQSVSHDFK